MTSTADTHSIPPQVQLVRQYFMGLQDQICTGLEALEGTAKFSREELPGEQGALARPRVMADGAHIEKAAVQFTHSIGASLPPAATERNPQLAGHGFQATAISLIVHPRNPMVPTTHMNLRYFHVDTPEPFWYFGGGFDLTPYYGFTEDCVHWHQVAQAASGEHYPAFKQACDDYFFIPHRQEQRGIGGLFFDDWREGGFDSSLALATAVGDAFLPAYQPIFERRVNLAYSEAQREFQLYRRGRYVEFNLVHDRGTQYGLQSGRRVESVLASLPPLVAWHYAPEFESGSPEANLLTEFLSPRDWIPCG
jgi:coproporphyrinogen III oxidase